MADVTLKLKVTKTAPKVSVHTFGAHASMHHIVHVVVDDSTSTGGYGLVTVYNDDATWDSAKKTIKFK
jgi:hypothetical protein